MIRLSAALVVFLGRNSSSFIAGRRGFGLSHSSIGGSATSVLGRNTNIPVHHPRRHRSPRRGGSIAIMSSSSTPSADADASPVTASASPSPPVPRREEERVVYAGKLLSSGTNNKSSSSLPLRQSNESNESLLDPPVPISDPYGWMRNDDRSDVEVLKYLEYENEYSREVTSHLKGLQEELYGEFLAG
jgi:hypothetical protein